MKIYSGDFKQRGVTLIEALISIGIFSFGILGLIGLQATAIRVSADAKERAEAVILANSLIGRLSVSEEANKAEFAYRADGQVCDPEGAGDTDTAAQVDEWLVQVAETLPGATSEMQQVIIDPASDLVTINMCWRGKDERFHQHSVVTQMQWQGV
ncbi:MAG: type IV pilus modification protein PilV [Burkholderiaceae bacterium]